jgi:hypothetical protein
LIKAQGFLTGQTLMGIESSDEMAEFVWEQRISKGSVETLDSLMTKYNNINKPDIMNIMDYIAPDKWFQYHVE